MSGEGWENKNDGERYGITLYNAVGDDDGRRECDEEIQGGGRD